MYLACKCLAVRIESQGGESMAKFMLHCLRAMILVNPHAMVPLPKFMMTGLNILTVVAKLIFQKAKGLQAFHVAACAPCTAIQQTL